MLDWSDSACAVLPLSARVSAVLKLVANDPDTPPVVAEDEAVEWLSAWACALPPVVAFALAMLKLEALELAVLPRVAEDVAEELTEAWACVLLSVSAVAEQESPLPSVSDWVPVHVIRAFAVGARLPMPNQMASTVNAGRTSLLQCIALPAASKSLFAVSQICVHTLSS